MFSQDSIEQIGFNIFLHPEPFKRGLSLKKTIMMKYYFVLTFVMISQIMQADGFCRSGNCNSGTGTLVANNYVYTGAFSNGKFHGSGKIRFSDESKYEGTFVNGLIDGVGMYKYSGGHSYNGEFQKNTRWGKGKMVYSNGDVYKGDWKSDLMHGIGNYIFKDGTEYAGRLANNMFAGPGKMKMPNGKIIKGVWKDNQLLEEENSKASVDDGGLKDCNQQYCHQTTGTYVFSGGTTYTGRFIDGKPSGQGRVDYTNGNVYTGDWINGAPHGAGRMLTKDGRVFEGDWAQGKFLRPSPEEATLVNNKPQPSAKKDGVTTIYSMVVGIANYKTMPSLKYTDDDAYQFFAFVKSPEGGAVKDNNVSILVDDAATSAKILSELKKITSMADADDEIMVYLSGHGLNGGFVPYDYGEGASIIPYQILLEIIDASPAKNKICFADACYSGSMAARSPYFMGLDEFYTKLNQSGAGTALIMSSMNQEVSLEYSGIRQGIFSHYLLKGLKGAANTANDRIITVDELFSYISARVTSYTKNAQQPNIAGNYDGGMPIAFLRQ